MRGKKIGTILYKSKNITKIKRENNMNTVSQILKKNAYIAAAAIVAFSALLPAMLAPLSASAAQVTTRSVQISSSVPSATGVTYQTKFTTATTGVIQGVVIDFCSNNPIPGVACTAPTGLTVGTGTVTQTGLTAGTWTATVLGGKALEIKNSSGASVTAGTAVTISTTGFVNPSAVNSTYFARIFTYATTAAADAYTSTAPGAFVDNGSAALSTAKGVNVSATVMETLNFCVYKLAIGTGCTPDVSEVSPTSITPLSIILGTGSPATIDDQAVYTDTVRFQLSTNALGATTINLKGTGTLTSGANTIAAAGTTSAIANGSGKFGTNVSATSTGGTGTVSATPNYTNAGGNYGLVTANVTSTYGDPIATSTGPIANANSTMTFGVSASPTTPAGIYTAAYSLIATSSY